MVEFYHYLFYKSYLWQVKVMKEIDYPIYCNLFELYNCV